MLRPESVFSPGVDNTPAPPVASWPQEDLDPEAMRMELDALYKELQRRMGANEADTASSPPASTERVQESPLDTSDYEALCVRL